MLEFVFTCPKTRLAVQGWVADSPLASEYFEAVQCTACNGVHLVNPRTAAVVGEPTDKSK